MSERVEIAGIAAGGAGVGRLADGRVVFVPRTAPGDVAEVEVVRAHARHADGRLRRLLARGPGRVEPRCAHYDADRCGGCQLQHLDGDTQAEARRRLVGDALRRLGKLDVDDPALERAGDDWGYRTRITVHAPAGPARIGFHPHDDPAAVFDLVQCHLASASLAELWTAVRAHRGQLPRDLRQVELRQDRTGHRHLVLRTARHVAPAGLTALHDVLHAAGVAASVHAGRGAADEVSAFEQVHPAMGDRVRAWAVAQLGDLRGARVWDLYAGIGETTRLLAAAGAEVESVERDPAAVRRARSHAPAGAVVHEGTVEALAPSLAPPAAVVTNPPRAGMAAMAIEALRAARPGRLVYVSCDPATLARDLRRLGAGWRVVEVRAFDLFPQTAHVETVVTLEAA